MYFGDMYFSKLITLFYSLSICLFVYLFIYLDLRIYKTIFIVSIVLDFFSFLFLVLENIHFMQKSLKPEIIVT